MLFAEHSEPEVFRVLEATNSPVGLLASFIRSIGNGLARLEEFFRRTRRDYTRFNYLGEWHSHPAFALEPSHTDDDTMRGIASDPETGALFVVLMIVKAEAGALRGGAWAYFPGEKRRDCAFSLEESSTK